MKRYKLQISELKRTAIMSYNVKSSLDIGTTLIPRPSWLLAPITLLFPIFISLKLSARQVYDPATISQKQNKPVVSQISTPTINQLRSLYLSGCLEDSKKISRRNYCICAFERLMMRYDREQFHAMNQIASNSGIAIQQFARIAFQPEYSACRASTGFSD